MLVAPVLFAFLSADPSLALNTWFSKIADKHLEKREAEISTIRNKEQAEARKTRARAALLKSLNGLPDYRGPLNPHTTSVIDAGAYRVEMLTFESQPHYLVTANLYVPKSAGKHPAVLFAMGHWDRGKPFAQGMAGNLARKGFVVLAFDPVGQGERQQAYDPRTGRSLIGDSVIQHATSGASSLLIGDGLMRYFVFDGMRAIDYLVSLPEVDAERIGMTGCSGGGTATTFLAALEPRIKVAAPACYMQTFHALFTGPTGDSEQSNPDFVALGLDQTDLIELFSPKPWLMASTEKDFFTPAAAKPVYDEARRWYFLYGAEDRIKWVVGPGGHGTPLEVREAIYDWMIRWLGNDPKSSSKEEQTPLFADHQLWATPKGQLGAESLELYDLIRERMKQRHTQADLKDYLRRGMLETEPDLELSTRVLQPQGTPTGRAVLVVERQSEMDNRANELAAQGNLVMVLHPRGLPVPNPTDPFFADANTIRASLVGLNLPLLRARDVVRAVDQLSKIPGVKEIQSEARDLAGYWLLAAAAVDPRITSVHLTATPATISSAFATPLTRNLYQVSMKDFSLHWDTQDLIDAIKPRKITWVDPADWYQNVIPVTGDIYQYTKFTH